MEALQYQKILDIFNQAYPNMVNAASEEECDAVYQQMLSDMEAAGEEDVEAYITKTYFDRLALWGEDTAAEETTAAE